MLLVVEGWSSRAVVKRRTKRQSASRPQDEEVDADFRLTYVRNNKNASEKVEGVSTLHREREGTRERRAAPSSAPGKDTPPGQLGGRRNGKVAGLCFSFLDLRVQVVVKDGHKFAWRNRNFIAKFGVIWRAGTVPGHAEVDVGSSVDEQLPLDEEKEGQPSGSERQW
ncbi:UNVERIFIED_CONTAM: hypothetical protein HHA_454630 [Hammondia hammondi]|eukprot:XP_008888208.1 hypothetical protein HHA_454630 [Hammondia hammondi]